MNEEGTTKELQYHLNETDENEGTNWPNWRSTTKENNSRANNGTADLNMERKICSVESAKKKAIRGRDARLSNRTSIPLVKIQTINESRTRKNNQNKLNKQLFCEMVDEIQTDTERSIDESEHPCEIVTMNTNLEGSTEKLHTKMKRTNGLSILVENAHSSDVSERHRVGSHSHPREGNHVNVSTMLEQVEDEVTNDAHNRCKLEEKESI